MSHLTCEGLLPDLVGDGRQPAIFTGGGDLALTHADLRREVADWRHRLSHNDPQLVFLFCRNAPETVCALLGAVAAGHAVALLDSMAPADVSRRLVDHYQPDILIGAPGSSGAGEVLVLRQSGLQPLWSRSGAIVLLSTSGTTGSPKFVRLSAASLAANARQISAALGIGPDDVALAHLPIHYSYGLSVVTSHLLSGAAVHLWSESITVPEFWAAADRVGGSHMPGVPFHYNFLARANIPALAPQSLRNFTQAGGPLDLRLQMKLHAMIDSLGGRFYVMYGQTEAGPRITTLPHERLPEKLGSVGPALSGGRITVLGGDGAPLSSGASGAVIYEGPNVMLGYAENRADLGRGDDMKGRLETGDIGYLDAEGFLFLTGREKRISKLYGLRINLADVEARFGATDVAALEGRDKIILFTPDPDRVRAELSAIAAAYKLPTASFSVRGLSELPRLASGKTDYQALKELS
jgi:acyl-coenzyme A synthetase/AMP-(fatty) acid ligase